MRDFQKISGIKQRRGEGNGFYFSLSSSRFGETKKKALEEMKMRARERKKRGKEDRKCCPSLLWWNFRKDFEI